MLIAEIGNNFFGDMRKAKEMIVAADASGADLIKGQAFRAVDIKGGSMPYEFYRECELSVAQCIELIEFARHIDNDMFFSIFSKGFEDVERHQNWRKVAGSQTRQGRFGPSLDRPEVIISVPEDVRVEAVMPFRQAEILHVSQYLTEAPGLERIARMSDLLGRQVGYSDHTIGVETAISAALDFGAIVIEKHFTLEKDVAFGGQVYRDTVHAATPEEFARLATAIN